MPIIGIQKKRTSTFNDQCINQSTAFTGSEGMFQAGIISRLLLSCCTDVLLCTAHISNSTQYFSVLYTYQQPYCSIESGRGRRECHRLFAIGSLERLPGRVLIVISQEGERERLEQLRRDDIRSRGKRLDLNIQGSLIIIQ